MKSFLIMILSAALAAAAYLTRPNEQDFKTYIKDKLMKDDRSLAKKVFNAPTPAEEFLKGYTFEDRFLYVQVERDGKPLYTGAFDRWYDHSGRAVSERQQTSR